MPGGYLPAADPRPSYRFRPTFLPLPVSPSTDRSRETAPNTLGGQRPASAASSPILLPSLPRAAQSDREPPRQPDAVAPPKTRPGSVPARNERMICTRSGQRNSFAIHHVLAEAVELIASTKQGHRAVVVGLVEQLGAPVSPATTAFTQVGEGLLRLARQGQRHQVIVPDGWRCRRGWPRRPSCNPPHTAGHCVRLAHAPGGRAARYNGSSAALPGWTSVASSRPEGWAAAAINLSWGQVRSMVFAVAQLHHAIRFDGVMAAGGRLHPGGPPPRVFS